MVASSLVPRHVDGGRTPGFARKHERGTASVELAFVLPLIMLGMGLIQFGRYLEVKQLLTTAAREGGRQASTGLITNDQTKQVVKDLLTQAGIPTANLSVTIEKRAERRNRRKERGSA
jgi:Flp pilus assembly protein TadG